MCYISLQKQVDPGQTRSRAGFKAEHRFDVLVSGDFLPTQQVKSAFNRGLTFIHEFVLAMG